MEASDITWLQQLVLLWDKTGTSFLLVVFGCYIAYFGGRELWSSAKKFYTRDRNDFLQALNSISTTNSMLVNKLDRLIDLHEMEFMGLNKSEARDKILQEETRIKLPSRPPESKNELDTTSK